MIFSTPITAIFLVQPQPQTIKQEIRVHIPCGHALPKLIGWFPAIPSVMTNDIASYKSAEYSQRWWQSCSSQLRFCFQETITVLIIFLKHSWWLTMYRELSEQIFAKSKQAGKRMWALNYIKFVSVGESHNNVTTVVVNAWCWWGASVLQNVLKTKDLIMK